MLLQPHEVGIETHECCKGSKDSELVDKKVSQEMFESIIREVVEEIGVPATSLVSAVTLLLLLPFVNGCEIGGNLNCPKYLEYRALLVISFIKDTDRRK